MCGIAGLWAPRLDAPDRVALVAAMVERIRHRGPSGTAVWDGNGVALGLARLAIVEPNMAARVLSNEEGTVRAVVNGEIYNHAALRLSLRARGHVVADGPDTTVVPHLYEESGAAFPVPLDGMFAVALWDWRAGRLLLARDRAGEKPLFYASSDYGFAFASEPGALAALPGVSRDPNPESLARYLVHGFFAGSDCAFASIRQLPPACVLEVTDQRERRTRYWQPWKGLGTAQPIAVADAPEQARHHLERAIVSRVPEHVPFGVFLSGGVDSSLVATLAARALGRGFPTFSLRIAHRGYDESPFARLVAQAIGSEHHELTLEVEGASEALESWATEMDQPLGDPSVLPTWALSRLAAQRVPVVLTGEGGDELFAGYPTYLGHRYARLAGLLPSWASDAAIALSRRFRPTHHHVTLAHMIERFLGVRGLPPFERHLAWFGTASPDEALRLLAPGLRDQVGRRAPLAHLDRFSARLASEDLLRDGAEPDLVAYQLLDFELYLSGDLLTKVDRSSMAHGLETRAPFLAHRLIEFALGLPEQAKLRGTTSKWALKRAAKGLLPDALLARRKQGFSPPFSTWARGPLRDYVTARLGRERVARAGVLDADAVHALLDAHLQNRTDRGRTLWTLLSLQMWAEHWLSGRVPDVAPKRVDVATLDTERAPETSPVG
ncbi:MAG TPA: asparagine synthase (glutamine-hydrolyzing) [Candidatus Limnocylindria bacterium]|nr:asparagine synthase (glutamine-hydrolyzing) [Candidatus Limnocylindria bacterium]